MDSKPQEEQVLQSNIEHRLQQLHDDYTGADPFPHVVIDEFFAADYAERLLAEFPPFEAGNALTEMGKLGKKSVNKDIEAIGMRIANWPPISYPMTLSTSCSVSPVSIT